MGREQWSTLYPLVVEACVGLFASCGIDLAPRIEPAEAALPEPGLLACIGFCGPQVRGSLGLCIALPLLRRAHPLSGILPEVEDADLRDWAGELVNQLMGRVKLRLLSQGVMFEVGTPTCADGRALPAQEPAQWELRVGDQQLLLRLVLEETLALAGAAPPSNHAQEGDLMLFE